MEPCEGISEVIGKPVRLQVLISTISRYLAGAKPER
jgi:hypothetical protein